MVAAARAPGADVEPGAAGVRRARDVRRVGYRAAQRACQPDKRRAHLNTPSSRILSTSGIQR